MTAFEMLIAHVVLGLASFAGLVLALAVLLPKEEESDQGASLVDGLRRLSHGIAASGPACVLTIFLIAYASGASNGLARYPVPTVNDEFAYLLGAETLAEGRLSNSQHPLWPHFETFSVSHDPVYVSKYPPAISGFMAIGLKLFGHPWWGQVLAYALASAALAWMLRAWVGPRWALIGGVLVALHPIMQHFEQYDYNWSNYSWTHSYWGGAVTMLGAALLFGGVRHFVRNGRALDAFWMAVGLVILALSRPFEGFLAAIPVGLILLRHLFDQRAVVGSTLLRLVVPMLLVLVPAAFFILEYNEATTGNPFTLAHRHYAAQYGSAAELLVLDPKDPPELYRNREMARFYMEWVRPAFLAQASSWSDYWEFKSAGLKRFFWFYLSFGMPALLGVWTMLHRRWWRLATGMTLLSVALVGVTFEFHPHYAATAAPLIHALIVIGLAQLWRNRGRFAPAAHLLVIMTIVVGATIRVFMLPTENEAVSNADWPRVRDQIEKDLEMLPGDDLVVVVYRPDHSVFREWVKNGADLDGAPVLWARDLGDAESGKRLLDYYSDRKVWVLRADEDPPKLQRYDRALGSGRTESRDEVGLRSAASDESSTSS